MADDKEGRENQARDADRRRRERAVQAELERGDEPEPPVAGTELADLAPALDRIDFPATGADVVASVGDHEIVAPDGRYTIAELLPESAAETFDSPAAVQAQVRRPTVAAAMKRVIEASTRLQEPEFPPSQRNAYELTLRTLAEINTTDDDEPLEAIADWIVERIEADGRLPGSRAVRRWAAKHCRANGYRVRTDEWLGI